MSEKIKIFLLFLACWAIIRIAIFAILTLLDLPKYLGGIKEFFTAFGLFILGIVTMPFSTFFDDWWFFLILTFLYFLFGGGVLVFTVLVILGMLISYFPSILGLFIMKNVDKN